MRRIKCWIVGYLFTTAPLVTLANSSPAPSEALGAAVYKERCVLCHGKRGRGDGALPKKVQRYPDTTLALDGKTTEQIRDAVIFGGTVGEKNPYSPPWGEELSHSEVESVVLFLELLSTRKVAAVKLLRKTAQSPATASNHPGRAYYISYCALCHGESGAGDGKMAGVIGDPPPYNLTESTAPRSYLREIIENGGAGVKRSGQMPPWRDEFSPAQLDTIIDYILTLRLGGRSNAGE